MRYMKRLFSAILVMLMLFALCSCGEKPLARYEGSFLDVFDTITRVVIYSKSEEEANGRFEELHALLAEYHRLYDIYNSYDGINNIKTVNENAGKAPVTVDKKLIDLVLFSKEMHALTGGKTNIALGPVLSIWHEYREAGTEDPASAALPPMEALREAAEHADISLVEINEENSTIFLPDEKMSLDVGAIAKGYAAQKAVEAMEEAGVSSMLLSVGGNVCAIGARADGKSWQVAVQEPGGSGTLCTVGVDGLSLVTSGTYQRFYTVNGVDHHHIIDPDTLLPSTYFSSVSVLCGDSGMADALSTALFSMPLDEGMAIAASLEGVDVFWVDAEGNETMTEGFAERAA